MDGGGVGTSTPWGWEGEGVRTGWTGWDGPLQTYKGTGPDGTRTGGRDHGGTSSRDGVVNEGLLCLFGVRELGVRDPGSF